jgi:hypothetical protein
MRFTGCMMLADFKIGTQFHCGEKLYLCTDVGTRTVVAIRIDRVEARGHTSDGEIFQRILTFATAQSEGWFSGPPYAVAETVFSEDDFPVCKLAHHIL